MKAYTEPAILQGKIVRLEPLQPSHAEGLYHVGQDPRIWEWMTRPAFEDLFDAERWVDFARQMHAIGDQSPFAIISQEGGIPIGSTRYLNINEHNKSLEIGWTWMAPPYWHTHANTEVKYLLLSHAFDVLNVYRVQFITDKRNIRSQRAIERLGAKKEGVLRSERINFDGHRRDSVYYSVLDREWPDVCLDLKARLMG